MDNLGCEQRNSHGREHSGCYWFPLWAAPPDSVALSRGGCTWYMRGLRQALWPQRDKPWHGRSQLHVKRRSWCSALAQFWTHCSHSAPTWAKLRAQLSLAGSKRPDVAWLPLHSSTWLRAESGQRVSAGGCLGWGLHTSHIQLNACQEDHLHPACGKPDRRHVRAAPEQQPTTAEMVTSDNHPQHQAAQIRSRTVTAAYHPYPLCCDP